MDIIAVRDEELIAEVESLAKKIWRQHYRPIIGIRQIEYMLEKFQSKSAISKQIKNGYLYFLIRKAKAYIGYLAVLPKSAEKELFLSKIYLKAAERGKGYGRATVDFIEQIARKNKLAKITLTVNRNNTPSIKAYQKMGFQIRGAKVQDIGEGFIMDDYCLERRVI
jgi:ribosomal protein S18 acetylase RimI-like enzyme